MRQGTGAKQSQFPTLVQNKFRRFALDRDGLHFKRNIITSDCNVCNESKTTVSYRFRSLVQLIARFSLWLRALSLRARIPPSLALSRDPPLTRGLCAGHRFIPLGPNTRVVQGWAEALAWVSPPDLLSNNHTPINYCSTAICRPCILRRIRPMRGAGGCEGDRQRPQIHPRPHESAGLRPLVGVH